LQSGFSRTLPAAAITHKGIVSQESQGRTKCALWGSLDVLGALAIGLQQGGSIRSPIPASDSKTEYKAIPLIPEDVAILKAIPLTSPAMAFFRHGAGIKGVADNAPFGIKYFYKWWVKACLNLGIEGVDLYGGTRHSSVRALRRYRSPEEIKRAAMSETNKAFERYMGKDTDDELRSVYRQSAKVISLDKTDKELAMGKPT